LEGQLEGLLARRRLEIYGLLSALVETVPEETVVSSVVLEGSSFQLDGVAGDALLLVELLREDPRLADLRLSSLEPTAAGGERFRLSGVTR